MDAGLVSAIIQQSSVPLDADQIVDQIPRTVLKAMVDSCLYKMEAQGLIQKGNTLPLTWSVVSPTVQPLQVTPTVQPLQVTPTVQPLQSTLTIGQPVTEEQILAIIATTPKSAVEIRRAVGGSCTKKDINSKLYAMIGTNLVTRVKRDGETRPYFVKSSS